MAPGIDRTELSQGLYPEPPNLTRKKIDPAQAFWVVKHGIKASAMPAWGHSMPDADIWNVAAFLQKLPDARPGAVRPNGGIQRRAFARRR